MIYLVENCGGAGLPFLPTVRGGWGRRRRPPLLALLQRERWIGATLDGGALDLVLARAVTALVEKAASKLEKTAAGRRRGGEREGGQRGGAMERDQGGRPLSGTVEILAVEPRSTWRTRGGAAECGHNRARPLELQ
jgi:hypothetical protein